MTTPRIQKSKLEDLREVLEVIEELIQDRITENNTVATKHGIMHKQHTHTYMYYRSLIWKAQKIAKSL